MGKSALISALIINTPKSCVKCPLFTGHHCFIEGGRYFNLVSKRAERCPLVEVPEGKTDMSQNETKGSSNLHIGVIGMGKSSTDTFYTAIQKLSEKEGELRTIQKF